MHESVSACRFGRVRCVRVTWSVGGGRGGPCRSGAATRDRNSSMVSGAGNPDPPGREEFEARVAVLQHVVAKAGATPHADNTRQS
jgi:hypothetical protein